MDYFGPVPVHNCRKLEKRYIRLFTCLETRAEVVFRLDTDFFTMVMMRFVGRRRALREICSDKDTNFVVCLRGEKQYNPPGSKEN